MTGLNPHVDRILSLSCLITDGQLNVVDAHGFSATIHTPQPVLSAMSPWCTTTHSATGLTTACLDSDTTAVSAADGLLAYIRTHVPERGAALLAGNSIHADRAFLSHEPWDRILRHLHYRVLDVSSIKEAVRRWAPAEVVDRVPAKRLMHRAREDVEESIVEARYYMRMLQGLGVRQGHDGEEKADEGH